MAVTSFHHCKIGILGGGQLGRMLLQTAIDFDLNVSSLDPAPDAPCKTLAKHFVQGALTDFDMVYAFGKTCDLITIEIENVNIEALLQLEKEGKTIYPQPHVIKRIQDKRMQKWFYKDNAIPTADFRCINTKEDINAHLDFLPAVQKTATAGYDGHGVQVLRSADDLHNALDGPGLLEKYIDVHKELAVIVARNPIGEVKSFPTVELVVDPAHNLMHYLFSPADIPKNIAQKATKIAIQIIQKLDMVGLLAVELFLTKTGDLLVNEVAPRPHNSGHHTIEANVTSQFEQHLRAILNLPLGSTNLRSGAAVVNVLGQENYTGTAVYQGFEKIISQPGIKPHLYGKILTKPARKMGHVTILENDPAQRQKKINFILKNLKVIA